MDASRYVRAMQRHALLVIVTAMLAVALTVVMLLMLPQRYRATADVVVLLPDAQTGSLLATTAQAVSDFEGAIRSSAVAGLTAEEVGVPASSVSDGLATEPLAGGTIVEVTFTGSDPDVAETIVTTASREAILLLLDARLGPVSQRLDAAQRAMSEANEAFEAFIIETELIDPEEFFFQQQRRLADLQKDQDQAEISGDEEAAASIQERIDALLQFVAPLRTEFDALRTAREQAAAGLQEARGAFATADASLQAAEEASSITVLPATRVPRTERLPSQLLVVVVVAAALTIGMIVLLELLAPQRLSRAGAARPSDAEPEASAPVVAVGARPDAVRPAASVPTRAASERAPRPVAAPGARPAPRRAEPAPEPGPRRAGLAPTETSARAAANPVRRAGEPLERSPARAVPDPRDVVTDRPAAERAAPSDRRPARPPAGDRAGTTREAARPDAGQDGPTRTASAPSEERGQAADAREASASDASTLEPVAARSSAEGRRPEANPSTSSAPAKRSRNRGKKRRSPSAGDAASSAGTTAAPSGGSAAPTSPVSREREPAPAAEEASAEGEVEAATDGRRSNAGREGGAVATSPSGDDRRAPAKSAPEAPIGAEEVDTPTEADTSTEAASSAEAAREDAAATD